MRWFRKFPCSGGTRAVAALAAVVPLTAALSAAVPAPSLVSRNQPPPAAASVSVKDLTTLKPVRLKTENQAVTPFRATRTAWPAAASGTVRLAVPAAGQPHAAEVKVAGTPLWVQAAPGTATVAGATAAAAAGSSAGQGPSQVAAAVLPQSAVRKLGISGVAFTVSASGRAGRVRVGLDYSGFSQAYGGNYGTRLRLVELPACALTAPQEQDCRRQVPLHSAQDYASGTLSAVVTLGSPAVPRTTAAAPAAVSGSAGVMVLAATTGTGQEGGPGGSYAASALKPSGTWTQGGASGAFTYSYPVSVPPASSRLTPAVSLNYDSQEVDGQTAVTQAQSSWLGDGWQTPDSYIALSTTPCADSPEGSASPGATGDECYDGEIVQMSLDGTDTPLVFVSSATSAGVTTSQWKEQDDSGAVIRHVSASSTVFGNYSLGGDYWTVTDRDGTQYEFGLQHLPGWASGDSATASVDTMPVYSAHPGDPCYSSSGFSKSLCPAMGYKWHLDYVTDTHGDAMSYYYGQTTNYYGEDNGASDVPYTSDSYLTEIDYGFRAGGAYGTVPDKVLFTTGPRCVATTCGALSTSNSSVGSQYPDVPADLICTSGQTCTSYAPSMFSEVRLKSITTEQYAVSAGAYKNIDTYALTETEPASGDGLSPTLWLASVQRTGGDTGGGGSSPVTLPPVKFGGTDLQNRVFTTAYPGLYRYRIVSVTSETGAVSTVSYGSPDPCSSSYSSSSGTSVTSANTDSCFPVYWTPQGSPSPVLDWFESYAVTQVLTADATGGALTEESDYAYGGGAAWHYDDNQVVQPKYRTWGQFRGYATVTAKTGQAASNPQTQTVTSYYRGMNGDTLPSGTSSVTLTDSQGGSHTDYNQLAGDPLETTTYLGAGGPVQTSSITSYWVSAATATMNPAGLPALTANMAEPAETWTRTAVTDGGETGQWTVTETDYSYDPTTTDPGFGLLQYSYSHTDPVSAAYDFCTQDQYAPANTAENLTGLISYTETDQVACSGYTAGSPASVPGSLNTLGAPASVSRPSQVTKATETFYDDSSFSTTFPQAAAPTTGNVTMTRRASGYSAGAFTWQTESRDTYDSYGRPADAYDADGNKTVTAYTVNSAGLTTATQVTAPPTTYVNSSGTTITTAHVSSQTIDPARNLTLTSTDQDGVVTTEQYDELGRLTSVWKDSRPTGDTANVTYAYTVSDTSLTGVVTQTLNEEANPVPSVTIYDSLGRVRQTQTLAPATPSDGRLVTDTIYDSRGWVSQVNHDYFDSSAEPALSLVSVKSGQVPDQDSYVYDGTGRRVEDINEDDGAVRSTSVTVYNGDSTTVIPDIPGAAASGAVPAGAGIVQTTRINPIGQTAALLQYTADPSLTVPSSTATGTFYITGGTPGTTSYAYDAQGNQDSVTSGGETWTSQYNLLGQKTSSADPDAGTTAMAYDGDGNLLQSKDAEGNYTSYTYDQESRKTAEYAAPTSGQTAYVSPASPGNETASWVYDNANSIVTGMADADGKQTTAYSYSGGYAYRTQQIAFNAFGESTGEVVYIPSGAPGSAITAGLAFQYSYGTVNGTMEKETFPAGGGLPQEGVAYSTTTALDLPAAVGGLNGYAANTSYTAWSQPEQVTLGSGSSEAFVTDTYDPDTGHLTGQLVTRSTGTSTVDNTSWAYDAAGQVTSETGERLGAAADTETQCFAYTAQGQLSQAWTATDQCAATPTTASHSTVGDLLGTSAEYDESWTYTAAAERKSQAALNTAAGTYATTSYGYGAAPGELTSATTTGATTATASYGYSADGQQNTRTTPADGSQKLTWNNDGNLTAVTNAATSAAEASYVYGPGGGLLSSTEGTTTTLYLPGEQLTDAGGTITGTRYYTLPGGITAVRTGSGTSYGFEISSDQHGTSTLFLDSTAQNPAWRQYDPFGNTRGTAPAAGTFPGDNRGFLNDPGDPATSLTSIGARWYDPAAGTFASLDPVLSATSPTQLNGYTYAGDDPVNASDPTGLYPIWGSGSSGCTGTAQGCQGYFNNMPPGGYDANPGTPTEPATAPTPAPAPVTCASVASRLDGGCTVLPAPANGTGNGWDFLAGVGNDLASVADEAYCIGSPFGCAMSYLGGTAPSQLYQDFVTSQGIDTTSGAYFAGTLTGTILLTAAGGAAGAADAGAAAAPAAEDALAGSGPARGIIEVSSRVKSTAAFENFNPTVPRDFVFDPASERLLVGGSNLPKVFGHSGLASVGGFDEGTVVGGRLSRGLGGEFLTNEWSGHFGVNWTDAVRWQFSEFMSGFGFDAIHTPWGGG